MKFISVLSLVILAVQAFCQNNAGYITYRFKQTFKIDGVMWKNATLNFSDSQSLFIYDKIGMDSFVNISKVYTDGKSMAVSISGIDSIGAQVYRNFSSKSIIVRETVKKPLEAFTINDDWVNINWTILNEFKKIDTFQCQKATGNFRGRKYTVWFTGQIPLPYGPWKLFGLPGLILEAKDHTNRIKMELVSVCFPCNNLPSITPPVEKETKTIKQYVHYNDHLLEHVRDRMQAKMPKGVKVGLDNPATPESIIEDRAYNLEKQYEWENPKDIPKPIKIELKTE